MGRRPTLTSTPLWPGDNFTLESDLQDTGGADSTLLSAAIPRLLFVVTIHIDICNDFDIEIEIDFEIQFEIQYIACCFLAAGISFLLVMTHTRLVTLWLCIYLL